MLNTAMRCRIFYHHKVDTAILAASGDMSLMSYNWHPSEENRMLAILGNGFLRDLKIPGRVSLVRSSMYCI